MKSAGQSGGQPKFWGRGSLWRRPAVQTPPPTDGEPLAVDATVRQPASVAQWAEAQCAPAGTVCRRGGVQSPGRPADFVFGFQGRML